MTDVLTRIVNGHPNSEIDQLLPWAYRRQDLKAVAWKRRLPSTFQTTSCFGSWTRGPGSKSSN